MKLIDKEKVVAEIERRVNDYPCDNSEQDIGYHCALYEMQDFLNTLEVKEVDLNKIIKDYFNSQPIITRSKGIDYQLIPTGVDIAKYFFELGLKAKKGE